MDWAIADSCGSCRIRKHKQKKKRKAKKATGRSDRQDEAEESDSEISEEESPKKDPDRVRLARADMDFPKRNLNEKINYMDKDDRKKFDQSITKAFCRRAKAAISGENASMTMKVWLRLNGGKFTETEGTQGVRIW